ncbi:PREDICTED: protein EMSY-like [Priapulus caudatus]|uniref:Protein EMSY-like n=1 Tax=Priapulus caudatus TaxID=37621 RepID=A0ABM1FA96_PRICU|nr:PREDICTED: protein EMSY-like [Priapulus caudatus]
MTKQVDRMWPTLLDMSRDECKRVLRRLELEAYSSFVSALRAQGDLSKEKKHLLEELCRVLSISSERHRAEVRRAVNDERLATIADCTSGPSTSSEWSVEGRRLVPILPRLVPQTAFTSIANSAANVAAAHNALLSQRHQSSGKPEAGMSQMAMNNNVPTSSPSPIGSTSPRSASPTSNVVVLPSGMSIQVKEDGEETVRKRRRASSFTESIVASTKVSTWTVTKCFCNCCMAEDGEETVRKRRRASSFTESIVAITKVSTGTVTKPMSSQVPASTALMRSAAANTSVLSSSASMPSLTPMKITLTKSPTKPTIVTTTSGQTQKVILVSNSNTPNSVIHRSFSVPSSTVVKTTPSPAAAAGHVRPVSALTAASLPTIPGSVVTMSVTGTSSTTAYVTNAISVSRPWPKTMPLRPATPPSSAHKLGLGRPAGVVSVSGGAPTVAQPVTRTVQMRTVGKPGAMQMKNDAGVKIITQTIPTSNIATGQSRILPKPTSYTTASASGGVAQTAARVINVRHVADSPRVSSCPGGDACI